MKEKELLRLMGIKKRFGSVEVLRGIDLSVERGEFVTLLGPSGCGKTTMLRIITGLENADEGRVFIDGRDVSGLAPDKRGLNMVFQSYALFPHMNVEQNIGYSLKLQGLSRAEIKNAAAEALAMVQLEGFGRRRPEELSGGQRQRVAVARALINRPRALLLDEPLGALDLQLRRQMQIELKRLQQRLGISFIYITHDQEEALTMSDRIAVLRNGLFEQTGSPAEVYKRPKTGFVAKFVGGANLFTLECANGSKTHIALREEHILLTPAAHTATDEAPPLGLPALITGKSFAGGLLRITARSGPANGLHAEGEISASRQDIEAPLEIGDRVLVHWHPDNAIVVDQ